MCNRGWYVCENFTGPMEMVERDYLFSMFNGIGLCLGLKLFYSRSIGLLDLLV